MILSFCCDWRFKDINIYIYLTSAFNCLGGFINMRNVDIFYILFMARRH